MARKERGRKAMQAGVVGILLIIGVIIVVSGTLSITGKVILEDRTEKPHISPSLADSLKESQEKEVVIITRSKSSRIAIDPEKIKEIDEDMIIATISDKELRLLEHNPEILIIEEQQEFDTSMNDAVTIVGATASTTLQVNETNITGKGETICIIDTGIDFTHPDLTNSAALSCILDCVGPCALNCSDTDLNGHGTHVAGIAAANGNIRGIAPEAKLIALKVYEGSAGDGAKTADIRRAIKWCVNNAATYNISVISMSFGTSSTYTNYCDANFAAIKGEIDDAIALNISVVAATGNQGRTNRISSPACISNVIPVAATNKDDSAGTYSNVAFMVQLMAPGTAITSTCSAAESSGPYCEKTGTSMSTPMVSGTAALMNQYSTLIGKPFTPVQIETILNTTGKPINYASLVFSRINSHSALLSQDILPPSVTLVHPQNGFTGLQTQFNFTANVSDWQLHLATLKLWKNNQLVNTTTINITGTVNQSIVSVENLESGKYIWNYQLTDAQGNNATQIKNFTLSVGGIIVTLATPENMSYHSPPVDFICGALTTADANITLGTILIWNSSSLVTSHENNSIGSSNQNYYLTQELVDDTYHWNCIVNNSADISAYAETNNTFTVDSIVPVIELVYPEDDITIETTLPHTQNFTFTVQDTSQVRCDLVINDERPATINLEAPTGENYTLSTPLAEEGEYLWRIECTDNASIISSDERILTMNAESEVGGSGPGPSSGGGGGGGGGGGSSSGSGGIIPRPSVPNTPVNETPQNETEDIEPNTPTTGQVINEIEGTSLTLFGIIVLIILALGAFYILYKRRKKNQFNDVKAR